MIEWRPCCEPERPGRPGQRLLFPPGLNLGRTVMILTLGAVASALSPGCGLRVQDSPYREFGADGQAIVFDDIRTIINDSALTTDQKRRELRSLGIVDEDLLDVLLGLN